MQNIDEIIADFYFIVFSPNPNKNIVRVIVDDGSVKLYMNVKKFVNTIKDIMNEKASIIVRNCCETYGSFYLIDRNNDLVLKLNTSDEKSFLNLKQLHDDIMTAKQVNDKDVSLRNRYITALSEFSDQEIKRGTQLNSIQNPYSATIIYGQDVVRNNYRPY